MFENGSELLSEMKCTACSKNSRLLNQDEITRLQNELPDWQVVNDSGINKLSRRFVTKNYTRSMAFWHS